MDKFNKGTQVYDIQRIDSHDDVHRLKIGSDILAIEAPLEIRIEFGPEDHRVEKSLSVTMRTPGNDFELAVGFLCTEGILRNVDQLRSVEYYGLDENIVLVKLAPECKVNLDKMERHFYTTSSCGVCGKTSLDAIRVSGVYDSQTENEELLIPVNLVHRLPNLLRKAQGLFESTGGLHASSSFDRLGNIIGVMEDVGRHNALDKLIGRSLLKGTLPLKNEIILLSGRASFELVQKASLAGLKILASVGAPSSLAVDLARESNMTLLGFVRNHRFNVYSGIHRIKEEFVDEAENSWRFDSTSPIQI